MSSLVNYLGIVVGDSGDSEKMLPDIVNQYLINSSDISSNFTLYTKFSDNGMM